MTTPDPDFTVVHTKFSTYLSWSQPFLHDFLVALGGHLRTVVVCTRTENLARFPLQNIVQVATPSLLRPSHGLLTAAYLERTWQPRAIHAHFGFSGVHSLLLKQLLNIPLVTTFGGRDATAQLAMPRLRPLYEVLLAHSDSIVAVSNEIRGQLVAAGASPDRVDVIRRGTDLRKFDIVDRSGRDARSPVRLLMVGRIVEKKGHCHALEAVARLAREGLDLRLTIVGDGARSAAMRRMAADLSLSDVVEFTGAVEQDRVRKELAAADILLHCSVTAADGDREGIPNALVEAAATGLPAIGTRHGGIVEAIKDGRTGLLVEERDVAALASAIRQLAESLPTRLAMGQAAARFMRDEFDADRLVLRHVALYRELARERRPARRAWYPEDFVRRVVTSMRDRRHAREYSVAELLELLTSGQQRTFRLPAAARQADRPSTDGVRFLGRFMGPRLKAAIRSGLASTIDYRERVGGRFMTGRIARLDRLVLDQMNRDVPLSAVDERWDLRALERYLRSGGDHRTTRRHLL